MTFISHFDKLQIYPCSFPSFQNFHVLNLNYTYKNTLNMLKTTRVYFGILHTLSQVKLSLRGKILKTFVIGVDETLFSIKIVSPYFQCEHNSGQFQIMRRVVLFMWLQLP